MSITQNLETTTPTSHLSIKQSFEDINSKLDLLVEMLQTRFLIQHQEKPSKRKEIVEDVEQKSLYADPNGAVGVNNKEGAESEPKEAYTTSSG